MIIEVDHNRCSGQARCATVASAVFILNDEGYNHMGRFQVPAGLEAEAQRGARACPERAITVIED